MSDGVEVKAGSDAGVQHRPLTTVMFSFLNQLFLMSKN